MLPGAGGPRIVLCTEGTAVLRASGGAVDGASVDGSAVGGADLVVGRGQSCFLSAADGVVTATGPASVFIATTGL